MKTEWLNQHCDYMNTKQIKMSSYFNLDLETDWTIFDGKIGDAVWNNFNTYTAYKNCLLTDGWILANNTNPRLITDEQFSGKF